MMLGDRLAPRRAKGDANIVAMLSLKLLLLAFFILLSTISQFEERRSRAVMDSLSSAFHGPVISVVGMRQPDSALGMQDRQAGLRRQIEMLFRQTLPVVEVESAADGRVLRLETAAGALFAPGSAALIAQRGTLLQRLARVLSGPDGPQGARVEILHAIPPDARGEATRLPVDRAGVLVRRMAELGLARDRLAAGLWPAAGAADRIAFEIRLPQRAGAVDGVPAPTAPGDGREAAR